MILNNLKNAGYVDKKAYEENRILLLTAKGERKGIEVVKSACGSYLQCGHFFIFSAPLAFALNLLVLNLPRYLKRQIQRAFGGFAADNGCVFFADTVHKVQ